MSTFQCQNLCLLSLAFIIDWKVVAAHIAKRHIYPHLLIHLQNRRLFYHKGWRFSNAGTINKLTINTYRRKTKTLVKNYNFGKISLQLAELHKKAYT